MKIQDILKRENVNKKYRYGDIMYYVDYSGGSNDNLSLFYETGNNKKDIVGLSSWMFDVDFVEVKNDTGWIDEINYGDEYYTIGRFNNIDCLTFINDNPDDSFKNTINMFSTKDKAVEVTKEQLLYRKMKKFRDINDRYVDWMNDSRTAWYIYKNTLTDTTDYKVGSLYSGVRDLHTIYFTNKELAQKCLNEVVLPFLKNNK